MFRDACSRKMTFAVSRDDTRTSKASLEMDLLGVVAHAFNPRQGQGMPFEFYVVSSRPANAI